MYSFPQRGTWEQRGRDYWPIPNPITIYIQKNSVNLYQCSMFPLPEMVLCMFKTSSQNANTPSQTGIPLLLSPLSSLVVDFGDGGALSVNKQTNKRWFKDDFCQVILIIAVIILTWPFCMGWPHYKSLWKNSMALAIMCCFVVYLADKIWLLRE